MKRQPESRCHTDLHQFIRVVRVIDGWTWALIDEAGAVRVDGVALEQQAAMEAAWRAAKSSSDYRSGSFPEIIVEQCADVRLTTVFGSCPPCESTTGQRHR